jgi:hypothetical protein
MAASAARRRGDGVYAKRARETEVHIERIRAMLLAKQGRPPTDKKEGRGPTRSESKKLNLS